MGRNNPYEKTGAGPDTFDYYYLVRIHGKHQRESSRTTASGSIEITYSFKDRTTLTITRNRDGSGSRTVVEPNGQRRTRNYPNPHTRSNGTTGGGVNLRLRKMTLKMAATNMLVATQLHDQVPMIQMLSQIVVAVCRRTQPDVRKFVVNWTIGKMVILASRILKKTGVDCLQYSTHVRIFETSPRIRGRIDPYSKRALATLNWGRKR
jgi:hypothetical protein